jgi:hypothetical protein
MIEKNSGKNASPASTRVHTGSVNSMSKGGEELEVICYSLWGKRRRGQRSEVRGQRSEVIRKSEKVAFLRGRDGGGKSRK